MNITTLISFLFVLIPTGDQVQDQVKSRARGIIEGVHLAADRAGSQINTVRIRAKAAGLIWKIDPELGRLRFTQLWEWVDSVQYTENNQDLARLEILHHLYAHDSPLANSLTIKLVENKSNPDPPSLTDRLNGKSARARLYNNLAARALDAGDNLPLVTTLLDSAFSDGYSYQSHATLRRLTEIDPPSGHKVAARLIETLQSQPQERSDQSLIAAQLLFEYFFPRLPGQNGGKMAPVGQDLRRRYYYIARSILQRSLLEQTRGGNIAGDDARLFRSNQAMLAASLNSIAKDFEDPKAESLEEMGRIADLLSPSLPPEFAGIRSALDTQNKSILAPLKGNGSEALPEDIVSSAIARGDIQLASGVVGQIQNDSVRNLMQQMLFTAMVRSGTSKRELAEALTTALKIENSTQRTLLLGDIAKAARVANEPNFTNYILSLIASSSTDWPGSERKATFLLDLTEIDRSSLMIDASINCLNTLPPEADRLIISGSFQRAFLKSATLDFDGTIEKLSDLKSISHELMARLVSSEALLSQQLNN